MVRAPSSCGLSFLSAVGGKSSHASDGRQLGDGPESSKFCPAVLRMAIFSSDVPGSKSAAGCCGPLAFPQKNTWSRLPGQGLENQPGRSFRIYASIKAPCCASIPKENWRGLLRQGEGRVV